MYRLNLDHATSPGRLSGFLLQLALQKTVEHLLLLWGERFWTTECERHSVVVAGLGESGVPLWRFIVPSDHVETSPEDG